MKRKVVQHGAKTLTISLPAEWAKRNNIKVGDELEVEEKLTTLEIGHQKKEEKKEISLNINSVNTVLFKRLLSNLYKAGYHLVILQFPDTKIKDIAFPFVQEYVEKTIGWELTEQHGNKIGIESFAIPDQEKFSNALRKYFLFLMQMTDDFAEIIKHGNLEKMDSIIELEKKHNALHIFCIRILNTTKHMTRTELPLYFLLIERLEEVGDEYKYMAQYLLKNKKVNVSTETKALLIGTNKYLREVYEFYYNFEQKKVLDITARREEFEKHQASYFHNRSEGELPIVHFLCSAFIKIYEASSPIVGIKLGDLEKEQKI